MYPGVIVEYDDQSDINSPVTSSEVRNVPLFGAIFTSDKGPEEWTRVSGEDFFKKYGKTISYTKHGQPLLQAAMSINAGAELLCKRLVASDAYLANLGIVATVSKVEVESQVFDEDGNPIFLDEEGNDTTEDTGTPKTAMHPNASIKYSTMVAPEVDTIDQAVSYMAEEVAKKDTENSKNILLYVFSDVGRGVSKKNIKIIPNYRLSKSLDYVLYTLSILENGAEIESMTFSTNPDIVASGQNISLSTMVNTYSSQIKCVEIQGSIDTLIEKINEYADPKTIDVLWKSDVLFGKDNKGVGLANVIMDPTGISLDYSYGQPLYGGNNGTLGSHPFIDDGEDGTIRKEYIKQALNALDGSYDTVIFNVDHHMLTAWVDANYPVEVKNAIMTLASFREDFEFFADMGLGLTNLEQIKNVYASLKFDSKFCSIYCSSYDIIDPYTKKQIPVTIGYSLAQLLVAHVNNGASLPLAGMKYGMTIKDAIYGTLSFSPTICPEDSGGNQKEALEEMHVNYASYIDNQLVIETLYTSQSKNTQWSYINNVMAVQEMVKDIRIKCPAIRYTFIDGEDLERYKADVEEVLSTHKSGYKSLAIEFKTDATYSANKIFYAVLKVVHKDFVQTEWFKITALSATDLVEI